MSVFPKCISFVRHNKKNFKMVPTWSNKVCFRPFQNDQKQTEINYLMNSKDFWGVFWLLFTYEIHNQCHPFGPCQRRLDKFCPDFCHFQILVYNFVYNVKVHVKLTGIHTSRTLANMGWTIFNIFDFWGLDNLFPPGHDPSNIHFFLLNPIELP